MGVIDLASALLSHPHERLKALVHLVPTAVLDTSRTFTLLAGALLMVTAWGLRRGKRRAYVLALFLCAVSVPVNLLKAFDLEEATVATTLMFLLAINSEAFRVQSRAITRGVLGYAALWGLVALIAYALAGDWVMRTAFAVEPSWGRAFADAGWRLFGVGSPVLLLTERLKPAEMRIATWYLRSLPVLSLAWVVFAGIALLRPAAHGKRHQAERVRVREIVARDGTSSLSWFALDESNDYLFSRNGRAVIAYRFEHDVLLGIGDPIGPPEELLPLLRDYVALCHASDWTPAVFQARPEHLGLYQSLGWNTLPIGVDPLLDPKTFSLEGGAIGDVRRSARKCDEAGVRVRHFVPATNPFTVHDAPAGWLDQMRAISNEWLHGHAGGEKGFCMGRFDPRTLDEVWVAVAWNERTDRVEAFTTWVPIPARRGWALDLMRRHGDAVPGSMELIIVKSVEAARERGDAVLSLSLSPLATVETGAAAGTPVITPAERRALALLRQHLAQYYDFEGVFRWKKKFVPTFEDRYLVYPSPFALPAVAFALIEAQSPEGLLGYAPAWIRRLTLSRPRAREVNVTPARVG
jgi:phosphatidylglycerol lysyltransferase